MCACGRGGIPCDSLIDWVTIHSPLAVSTITVGTFKRSNNIPLCYLLLSIIYLTTRNVRQHELLLTPRLGKENTGPFPPRLKSVPPHINITIVQELCESRGGRPNELSGFRGRKDLLNHASALVSACP